MNSVDLRTLRENRNMTQNEVAGRLNVSRTLIYKFENGSAVPSDDLIKCLADIYDLPVDYVKSILLKDHYMNERVAEMTDQIDDFHALISKEIADSIMSGYDLNEIFNSRLRSLKRDYLRRLIKMSLFTLICILLVCLSAIAIQWGVNNSNANTADSEDTSEDADILVISDGM